MIAKGLVKVKILPSSTRPSKRRHIRLNFITVPLASVLILLACGAIDGSVLKRGIIGADGVKPLNIMALFISLVRGHGIGVIQTLTAYAGVYVYISGFHRSTQVLRLLGCA